MIFNISKNNIIKLLDDNYKKILEKYYEEHYRLLLSNLYSNTSGITRGLLSRSNCDLYSSLLDISNKKRITYSLLLETTDNKYVLGFRKDSFAYQSINNVKFEITSVSMLFKRVSNMYRSFTSSERIKFQDELRKPIVIPNKKYISLIEILKLLEYVPPRISSHDVVQTNEYVLPGGQINRCDKTILETLIRETREELSLGDNVNIKVDDEKFIYLNTFDTIINKFFHNIIFHAKLDMSSIGINNMFKPNYEINSVMCVDMLPSYLDILINQSE